MAEGKFSVIIVSWNVKAELERCLASLRRERNGEPGFTVTVVDNASADGTAAMVRQKFPNFKLIAQDENIGFARACNLGAQDSSADYLVFLNPDTEITTGFFSDLERSFIHHPQAGVIGGHIINSDGSTQPSVRNFPSTWVGLLEATKLLGRCPWLAPQYLLPQFNYRETQAVAQVMGACLAVRNSVWQELGGFDNKFFLWFEEVDFCKRVNLAGYEVWYDHHISLVHIKASSFSQISATARHRYFMKSLVRYLYKHVGLVSAGLVWLLSRPWFIVSYFYDHIISPKTSQAD